MPLILGSRGQPARATNQNQTKLTKSIGKKNPNYKTITILSNQKKKKITQRQPLELIIILPLSSQVLGLQVFILCPHKYNSKTRNLLLPEK